jgi:phosphate transport system permease protein
MTTLVEDLERHPSLPDPTAPLTASGNLRRRAAVSRAVSIVATVAAVFAVALLADVIVTVVKNGAPVLSLGFLIHNNHGLAAGGGIANALLGTLVIVTFAALIAVPVGILTALYLTEFASPRSRAARTLQMVLDMLQGMPTIMVGIVVFGLIVSVEHVETGLAGAIALSIIMLPLIARSSQEVLRTVPGSLRDAADALGVPHWRAVLGVILPTATGGIATGAILSIARASGETAPLLIVNSIYNPNATQLNIFGHGVPSIPMYIYTTYDLPTPTAVAQAWGAALVLLAAILIANVGARILLARSRAKMGL